MRFADVRTGNSKFLKNRHFLRDSHVYRTRPKRLSDGFGEYARIHPHSSAHVATSDLSYCSSQFAHMYWTIY